MNSLPSFHFLVCRHLLEESVSMHFMLFIILNYNYLLFLDNYFYIVHYFLSYNGLERVLQDWKFLDTVCK